MKRNIEPDQLDAFLKEDRCKKIDDFTENHSPGGFCFSKDENSVIYYRLVFQSGIPKVKESINISSDLNVSLSYQGIPVPLPEWLRTAKNCKITRFSQLCNLPPYIQNRIEDLSINEIFEEIRSLSLYKPQGRPPYSSKVIRYCLLLRYSSRQAYTLLLKELPLPSFSLLEKLSRGSLDALKVAKVLLDGDKISKDCMVLFDEMYLQKGTQYQGGRFIGANEFGDFFKGIVCFMIIGLKQSVPIVVKAVPEVNVSGDLIYEHLFDIVLKLSLIGFNVRAAVADDHSSNVNAFTKLGADYGEPESYFIYHPAYNRTCSWKICCFLTFDTVVIISVMIEK